MKDVTIVMGTFILSLLLMSSGIRIYKAYLGYKEQQELSQELLEENEQTSLDEIEITMTDSDSSDSAANNGEALEENLTERIDSEVDALDEDELPETDPEMEKVRANNVRTLRRIYNEFLAGKRTAYITDSAIRPAVYLDETFDLSDGQYSVHDIIELLKQPSDIDSDPLKFMRWKIILIGEETIPFLILYYQNDVQEPECSWDMLMIFQYSASEGIIKACYVNAGKENGAVINSQGIITEYYTKLQNSDYDYFFKHFKLNQDGRLSFLAASGYKPLAEEAKSDNDVDDYKLSCYYLSKDPMKTDITIDGTPDFYTLHRFIQEKCSDDMLFRYEPDYIFKDSEAVNFYSDDDIEITPSSDVIMNLQNAFHESSVTISDYFGEEIMWNYYFPKISPIIRSLLDMKMSR